jgi:unsaturated rhamnogalacturonyl hydrolase
MEVFIYTVLILVLIVFLIDFIPQFNTWQSRIKIGQFSSKEEWKTKVLAISKKWLFKTPTIKLTDNSRLIIIDIVKGNYKKNAIQHWQEAALLLGLIEEYKSSKSETTKVIITTYLDSKIDGNGNWKNPPSEIDGVILAYALLSIPWLNHDKNKPAFDAIYNLILSLKGEDGTIAYKKHSKSFRYVDTIGFICPFLVAYGIKYNNEEAVSIALKQISEFNNYALLKDTFIPCHTYNLETKLPVGLFGWGRGLGWYAIGLIDAWNELPVTHPNKKLVEENVIHFAKMAMQFQQKNGGWNWLITNKSSQFDSSTVATLAWFLANAATIESISNECKNAKENALNYLQKVTRRSGAIDFSQGDTKGIGIHSQHFDILPFTQGFVLRTLHKN